MARMQRIRPGHVLKSAGSSFCPFSALRDAALAISVAARKSYNPTQESRGRTASSEMRDIRCR